MSLEYRVTWQREGKKKKARIYQTKVGAESLLHMLQTSSPDDHWGGRDQERWERMTAPFSIEPRLQSRLVGTWHDARTWEEA